MKQSSLNSFYSESAELTIALSTPAEDCAMQILNLENIPLPRLETIDVSCGLQCFDASGSSPELRTREDKDMSRIYAQQIR